MIKIMFVCHGNICRSPMAEFMFKDLVEKKGEKENFIIASSGTSSEEYGNPVHYGTRKILDGLGISCAGKRAVTLKAKDYENYDYFIGMDNRNLINIERIFGGDKDRKIRLLLSFAGENKDVADPYWFGNFEETKRDVERGVKALYEYLKNN